MDLSILAHICHGGVVAWGVEITESKWLELELTARQRPLGRDVFVRAWRSCLMYCISGRAFDGLCNCPFQICIVDSSYLIVVTEESENNRSVPYIKCSCCHANVRISKRGTDAFGSMYLLLFSLGSRWLPQQVTGFCNVSVAQTPNSIQTNANSLSETMIETHQVSRFPQFHSTIFSDSTT